MVFPLDPNFFILEASFDQRDTGEVIFTMNSPQVSGTKKGGILYLYNAYFGGGASLT